MTHENRRVAFKCWACGKITVVAPACCEEELRPCCFDTLKDMAEAFSHALIHQLPHHITRMAERQATFNDRLADAAMLSPDPEVRAAAIRWRNERAAQKDNNG